MPRTDESTLVINVATYWHSSGTNLAVWSGLSEELLTESGVHSGLSSGLSAWGH